jgi:hypothetical protein
MKKVYAIFGICFLLVSTSCSSPIGLNGKSTLPGNSITPIQPQKIAISFTHTPTAFSSLSSTSTSIPSIAPAPIVIETSTEIAQTQPPQHGPVDYRAYIGTIIPPMPSCCFLEGGGFIEGQESLAIDFISDKDTQMVWITQITHGSDEKVLDILILPKLNEAEIFSANYCRRSGKDDPYLFTISALDRAAVMTRFITNEKIRKAWRIDPTSGWISEVSTARIECSAEGGFDPNNVIYQFLKGQK